MNPLVVLTVAGTDSGGAAGVAADLATFAHLGAHGACAVTAVTAQDTTGVHAVHAVPAGILEAQLAAVAGDLPVAALKTGMLGSPEIVVRLAANVARFRRDIPVVVDPVLRATSGAVLADEAVVEAYRRDLLPLATVVTPNLDEARALAGHHGSPAELATMLAALGPAVVVTGGPEPTVPTGRTALAGTCVDWLALPGQDAVPFAHSAVETGNDHGTGCTFSAALAVHLGRGQSLTAAVRCAASYTSAQLHASRGWTLGSGRGPVAHLFTERPTTEEIR